MESERQSKSKSRKGASSMEGELNGSASSVQRKANKRNGTEDAQELDAQPSTSCDSASASLKRKHRVSSEEVSTSPPRENGKKRLKMPEIDSTESEQVVKKRKKSKAADEEAEDLKQPADPTKPDANGNPPISDFSISASIQETLRARGITHMFPIQAACFDRIMEGSSLFNCSIAMNVWRMITFQSSSNSELFQIHVEQFVDDAPPVFV